MKPLAFLILTLHCQSLFLTSFALVQQKPFAVLFKKITCTADLAVDPYCFIKAVSRTKTLLSGGSTLKVPLLKLYMHTIAFYKNFNIYHQSMVDYKLEVCEFNEGYLKGNKGKIFEIFQNLLPTLIDVLTPLIRPCPYLGRVNVTNLDIPTLMLPEFLPVGDYRLDLRFSSDKNVTVYASSTFVTISPIAVKKSGK